MIRSQICLAAEGVSIDQQTNLVSIYSILEGVGAEGFPVLLQRIAFFALLTRDADDPPEHHGRFIVSLGENELAQQDVLMNFGPGPRTRVVVRMQGLVIPTAGHVTMRIRLGDETIAEYIFSATQQPQIAQVPAQAP